MNIKVPYIIEMRVHRAWTPLEPQNLTLGETRTCLARLRAQYRGIKFRAVKAS